MNVLQRAKASMPLLCKTRATKLLLVFASLLLCSTVLSLLTGAGTAHAAGVGSRSASVNPATSGGGCRNDSTGTVRGCISENSAKAVVPDMYVLHSDTCDIEITLWEAFPGQTATAWEVNQDNIGAGCYVAGSHFTGHSVPAQAGMEWYTQVIGYVPGRGYYSSITSPDLFT